MTPFLFFYRLLPPRCFMSLGSNNFLKPLAWLYCWGGVSHYALCELFFFLLSSCCCSCPPSVFPQSSSLSVRELCSTRTQLLLSPLFAVKQLLFSSLHQKFFSPTAKIIDQSVSNCCGWAEPTLPSVKQKSFSLFVVLLQLLRGKRHSKKMSIQRTFPVMFTLSALIGD